MLGSAEKGLRSKGFSVEYSWRSLWQQASNAQELKLLTATGDCCSRTTVPITSRTAPWPVRGNARSYQDASRPAAHRRRSLWRCFPASRRCGQGSTRSACSSKLRLAAVCGLKNSAFFGACGTWEFCWRKRSMRAFVSGVSGACFGSMGGSWCTARMISGSTTGRAAAVGRWGAGADSLRAVSWEMKAHWAAHPWLLRKPDR